MLRRVFAGVLPLILLLTGQVLAQAGDPFSNLPVGSQNVGDVTEKVKGIGMSIISVLAVIASIIFVVMFIWNAKKLALGSSDPHARAEAMKGFLYTAFAGLIAFSSWVIVGLIYKMRMA